MFEDDKLPRQGLREASFRKYEKFIEGATRGSYKVDPLSTSGPRKVSSFMVGLRDAIRGWKRFGYHTDKWPADYDVGRIKVCEGKDGMVIVENEYEDAQKKRQEQVEKMKKVIPYTVLGVEEPKVVNITRVNHTPMSINFMYVNRDAHLIKEAMEQCQLGDSGTKNGRLHTFLVYCASEEEEKKLKMWKGDYDNADLEVCNGGWWAITY